MFNCMNADLHRCLSHTVNFLSVPYLPCYVNHLIIFLFSIYSWPLINGGNSLYNLYRIMSSMKMYFFQLIYPSSSSSNSSASIFNVCKDLLFLLASSEDSIIKSFISLACLMCKSISSGCVVSPV